jgi:hypothetical protein
MENRSVLYGFGSRTSLAKPPCPLLRAALCALNRFERTIATHLVGLRQAAAFRRARDSSLEAATRGNLEAFMGELPGPRAPSTAATHHEVLKLLSCPRQRRRPSRAISAASQRRPTPSSVRMRLTDQPCST